MFDILQVVGTYLLWVDNTLAFFPKVPFQSQHHNGNALAMAMLEITYNVVAPLLSEINDLYRMNDKHLRINSLPL